MWLKRRKAPSAEIPKLRDEYKRLLNDTLPEVAPLQDVTRSARSGRSLREVAAVESSVWREHQRALRPLMVEPKPRLKLTHQRSRDERAMAVASYAMS
ncbi:hypothetical protein AAFO92_11570 [Roseovarius sp. CAU 1744]|uniref:hypothetical protein n=1 Tax=Roseovarius sp. CAU 1744 TaxID=3140368 RepID=UPI00325ADA8F